MAGPATGSAATAPGPAATSAPAMPHLDASEANAAFDGEAEDKDWAINAERAIKASVPDLTDIDCKTHQCRATLSAASEAELVAKTDKLSGEDSLRGTPGARSVLLTAPEKVDGKLSMRIYVRYDRQ